MLKYNMVIIEQEKFWMGKYGLSYAKRQKFKRFKIN